MTPYLSQSQSEVGYGLLPCKIAIPGKGARPQLAGRAARQCEMLAREVGWQCWRVLGCLASRKQIFPARHKDTRLFSCCLSVLKVKAFRLFGAGSSLKRPPPSSCKYPVRFGHTADHFTKFAGMKDRDAGSTNQGNGPAVGDDVGFFYPLEKPLLSFVAKISLVTGYARFKDKLKSC